MRGHADEQEDLARAGDRRPRSGVVRGERRRRQEVARRTAPSTSRAASTTSTRGRATQGGFGNPRTRRGRSSAPWRAASAWAPAPGTSRARTPSTTSRPRTSWPPARGIDVTNAPVYYARLIMAYVAMGRAGTIGTAGSKGVNLLNLLLTYQNTTEGSPTKGAFAPSLPVRSTPRYAAPAWAILAMHNAGVSQSDSRYLMAEELARRAAERHGRRPRRRRLPEQRGRRRVRRRRHRARLPGALRQRPHRLGLGPRRGADVPQDAQKSSGGFPATPGGDTDAEATSAAIQAILAMGEHPEDAALGRRDQHAVSRPSRTSSRPTAPTRPRPGPACGPSP